MKLVAAKELTETFEELTEDERKTLQKSLDELVQDTPRATVAVQRFKIIMKKVGQDSYEGLKSILVDIISETAKKTLFGP